MRNALKTLAFLLLFSIPSFAQNSLSGEVRDDQNQPIFFATVALYNQTDSVVVRATSTDENGRFQLSGFPDGDFFLEVTMLGYMPARQSDLHFPDDRGKTLRLRLSEDAQTLATAEVVAKVPLLEQKSDRLVVNVENNLTSLNGSLLDVMKKVPGMIVVGDKLRMAGQSNVTILINGKTTKYMDVQALLRDMPGDNVKRVEIIHQPGAEFDAEGTGAIINIILKKNARFGTNGSITAGLAKGNDWKYKTSLQLSHYQGDVNIYGGVGYRDYPWLDELYITRTVGGDVYDQHSFDPGHSRSLRANLGLDWNVTDRHRVGFSSRLLDSRSDNLIRNTTFIDFASVEETDLFLQTNNQQDQSWQLYNFNPYYTFEIDTAGQKIDLDFNVAQIDVSGTNTLTTMETETGTPYGGQQYRQPGKTRLLTTQLDYTLPINDYLKWQTGGKFSDAHLDNDLGSFTENGSGNWEKNLLQSNHFIFDETIAAAYTKLTYGKDKWSGTLGLRYENSRSTGYSVTIDSTLKRDISKFFPSLSLGRQLTDQIGATVAYSYRIDRPRYSSLNPFVYYLDAFTFEQGNPALAPALTHSMKFNLTYEKQPFFNIEYKLTKDAMVEVTQQNDETGEAYLTTVNLEHFRRFNVSLFFPLDFIPHISGYGGIIANHVKYDSKYLDLDFLRAKWDYTAFMQVNFTLPADIESEVSGWYNSGGQEGIINGQWLYGVDVGVSKKFLNDKAKVSIGVDNLLGRFFHGEIKYANMNLDIRNHWDKPVYNVQFNYKFGNQHMKRRQRHQSSATEELNRAGKN
ncbi:MAG: hypothetical protein D6714_08610 [Bacteroidetes bacterium]|nr:MAG: hypothetical protein D6714_08610 [Bacteroidota bacterium]